METTFERVLGSYESGTPGPVVVITACIHGNEPAGAIAARRVMEELSRERPPMRGRVLALCGNLPALARGERYVEHDLNRGWSDERCQTLLAVASRDALDHEDAEQWELLQTFRELFEDATEPVIFLDLHSTSAGGSPFCAIADTLRNRRIAFALPAPVILGLEETVAGTMLSYLDGLGHISAVFEGGQHDDPATVDNHVAAIWISLVAAGSLREEEVEDYDARVDSLRACAKGQPRVVELRYRHPVLPGEGFTMKPGYVNFEPVSQDEVVATTLEGDVRPPMDGRILMPLYQPQGDDGFFIVRDVRPFWLRVSAVIRRLRLDVLLPLLPGVRRHPTDPDALLADPRVARFFLVEIFHLFGFRRGAMEDGKTRFQRRRPDFRKIVPMVPGDGDRAPA